MAATGEGIRPIVLVIEATEPFSHIAAWHDWEPSLTETCGYEFVYFDGLNRFYVRRENAELRARFAFPPNVLDGFQTYATVQALQRAGEAESEAEKLRRQVEALREDTRALTTELREARQWVGRLSEQLAALDNGGVGNRKE